MQDTFEQSVKDCWAVLLFAYINASQTCVYRIYEPKSACIKDLDWSNLSNL